MSLPQQVRTWAFLPMQMASSLLLFTGRSIGKICRIRKTLMLVSHLELSRSRCGVEFNSQGIQNFENRVNAWIMKGCGQRENKAANWMSPGLSPLTAPRHLPNSLDRDTVLP